MTRTRTRSLTVRRERIRIAPDRGLGVTEAVEVAEVTLGACMEFRETPACREEGEREPVPQAKAERSEWVGGPGE